MNIRLILAAACGAAAFAQPAAAFTVAPAGTGAIGPDKVAIAPAPDGGALLAWTSTTPSGRRVQVSRQLADGSFNAPQTVLEAPAVGSSPFGALGGHDGAVVFATRGDRFTTDLVAIRRTPDSATFGPPITLATGDFTTILASAANDRGDIALIYSNGARRSKLVTALANGTISEPQDLGTEGGFSQRPTVAVGAAGDLVIAYHDGEEVIVRRGAIGSALGTPQTLAATNTYPDIAAAVDDKGNATVAFSRGFGSQAVGIAAARAAAGGAFRRPQTLDSGPNAQFPQLAAGGTTTALTWSDITSANPPRVAIAQRAGRFGSAQAPGTPEVRLHGEAGRYPSLSGVPSPAVSRAGGVLVAYPYGPFSASTHAVFRAAYASRFGKPHVLSALGHGGYPSVAFAGDRPLIAFSDRDSVFGYTRVAGPHPDLTPAGLTATPLSTGEMRDDGRVSTTIRCAEDCYVGVSARITTGRRGESVGQVISRPNRDPVVLQAGVPLKVTFQLTEKARTALGDTGRGQAKVLATMTNRSGASRTVRRTLDFGRQPAKT